MSDLSADGGFDPEGDGKTPKTEANYRRNNRAASRRCGNCANFIKEEKRCQVVEGEIRSQDVCDLWEPERDEDNDPGTRLEALLLAPSMENESE